MDAIYGIIRIILTVMGVLMVACGILFALQGAGIVMWPADSFMLKDRHWVHVGIMLANFGLLQLYLVRKS